MENHPSQNRKRNSSLNVIILIRHHVDFLISGQSFHDFRSKEISSTVCLFEQQGRLRGRLQVVRRFRREKQVGASSIYVGILCFESEVFDFLFSNFSFKID